MLAEAAARLNTPLVFLDSGHSPAKQIVNPANEQHAHVDGSFADSAKIKELAAKVHVLTVEIEHVDADALEAAMRSAMARDSILMNDGNSANDDMVEVEVHVRLKNALLTPYVI